MSLSRSKASWKERQANGGGGSGSSGTGSGSGSGGPPTLTAAQRAAKLFDQARAASQTQSAGVKDGSVSRGFHHQTNKRRKTQDDGGGTDDPFDRPLPALDSYGQAESSSTACTRAQGTAAAIAAETDQAHASTSRSVSLHELLKMLTSPTSSASGSSSASGAGASGGGGALTMREAMPIAGKLFSKGYTSVSKLERLSMTVLTDELGVEGEETRRRTLRALRGDAAVAQHKPRSATAAARKRELEAEAAAASSGSGADGAGRKRSRARRDLSPASLGREWGDMQAGGEAMGRTASASSAWATASDAAGSGVYRFNEVREEKALRGKYIHVNRAPVMTAWAVVVLEKLGFERDEALSLGECAGVADMGKQGHFSAVPTLTNPRLFLSPPLSRRLTALTPATNKAHCYVNATSTARGVSIGVLPAATEKERELARVGPNQPHFELMRVKIPSCSSSTAPTAASARAR